MEQSLVERVARKIAIELGDDFDQAFTSKTDWVNARGDSGGRFRDVNEPRKPDYLDAARAAIAEVLDAMMEPSEGVVNAGYYGMGPRFVWQAMIEQVRKEAGV